MSSVLTPNFKFFFSAAYFNHTRYGRSSSVVHAEIDVGVIQRIAESASDAAVTSFRNGFKALVESPSDDRTKDSNIPQYFYVLDKDDSHLEWKAFIVFLSFMLAGVHNKIGAEKLDWIPLMVKIFESDYFGSTSKPLGALLFGVARNKVSNNSVMH